MSERTDPSQDLSVDVDGWAPLGWEPGDPGLCDDTPFGTVLSDPVADVPVSRPAPRRSAPARGQQAAQPAPQRVPQRTPQPQPQQARYGTVPQRRPGPAPQQVPQQVRYGSARQVPQRTQQPQPQQARYGTAPQVPQYRRGPAPQRPDLEDVFATPRGRLMRAEPQKTRTQKSGKTGWSALFWIGLIAFGILRAQLG